MNWVSLLIGFLTGWTVEWIFYRNYWRRKSVAGRGARSQSPIDLTAWQDAGRASTSAGSPSDSERLRQEGQELTIQALAAPAAASPSEDNLEIIEGIGPKIAALLKEAGIGSFADLAAAETSQLHAILQAAGPRFRMANPATWPRQAGLAAAGRWDDLRALQASLKAGTETT
jgi:predicted flap endonuclease-1-like 5' DNA nuclease